MNAPAVPGARTAWSSAVQPRVVVGAIVGLVLLALPLMVADR
jgi:hypothetical protein